MATTLLGKRKDPPRSSNIKPIHSVKSAKIFGARSVLAQTSEKALNQNGDLNVASFTKARDFEIRAMEAGMASSKNALSKRAFQQVPRSMRRRTASHNVKRIPKRLRAKAIRDMKEDNTPTVTARRRVPTNHKRLRLAQAKKLKDLGTLTKKKRDPTKKQKQKEKGPGTSSDIGPENADVDETRFPKLKKNTLTKPPKPPARFRKRQIHKSWLPTHIWHAKRAKMTEPKNSLWRFAIPLSPSEKCFRITHRSTILRGCVAYDTSYMGTIGVEGVERSLTGLLKALGIEEAASTGKREERWRRGTRSRNGWIRARDGKREWIAPVVVLWSVVDESLWRQDVDHEKQKVKRRLFIRVHPSAFLQVWDEVLKVAKIQRPQAMVEDLRFEIGSIEVTGPGAMEALVGTLHPISDGNSETSNVMGATTSIDLPIASAVDTANLGKSVEEWVDIPNSSQIFCQLAPITNPAALPPNALLDFIISDPRLHHPPRTFSLSMTDDEPLLNLLSAWPPDQNTRSPAIFDHKKRLTASRLPSQKAINRRKAEAGPGNFPSPLSKDPQIPVMIVASRTHTPGSAARGKSPGSYQLLLPWSCVQPVWYSLMHYPLSTGGVPRFGGLQEQRQTAFESQTPWFPGDFPGTRAGWEWELMERERMKSEWQRKPKGKRCEWESVNLGGKRGEIGLGWACDWERLLTKIPANEPEMTTAEPVHISPSKTNNAAAQISPNVEDNGSHSTMKDAVRLNEQASLTLTPPPIHQFTGSAITSTPPAEMLPTAVTPVHLTLLSSGHPSRNARIYRLPTISADLRSRWLALVPKISSNQRKMNKKSHNKIHRPLSQPKKAPRHAKAQRLAASLITQMPPVSDNIHGSALTPSNANYPPVPDEADLIGFVTSANYQLSEGRCEAIGSILIARVMQLSDVQTENTLTEEQRQSANNGKTSVSKGEAKLCIVRDAGQTIGRLARWTFI